MQSHFEDKDLRAASGKYEIHHKSVEYFFGNYEQRQRFHNEKHSAGEPFFDLKSKACQLDEMALSHANVTKVEKKGLSMLFPGLRSTSWYVTCCIAPETQVSTKEVGLGARP